MSTIILIGMLVVTGLVLIYLEKPVRRKHRPSRRENHLKDVSNG